MTEKEPPKPTARELRDARRRAHEAEKKHKPNDGMKGKKGGQR